MAFDPATAIIDLVKTGFNKFLPDKMSEVEKSTLKNQMTMFMMAESAKKGSAFNQFVLDYEGAAKDHGPFIKRCFLCIACPDGSYSDNCL